MNETPEQAPEPETAPDHVEPIPEPLIVSETVGEAPSIVVTDPTERRVGKMIELSMGYTVDPLLVNEVKADEIDMDPIDAVVLVTSRLSPHREVSVTVVVDGKPTPSSELTQLVAASIRRAVNLV